MFTQNLVRVWVGILLFSGVFLLGQEAWPPPCDIVVDFPDPNLGNAIRGLIQKYEGDICAFDLAGLTDLDARGLGISDLSGLEYCKNLYWLDLSDNQITDLSPLAGMTRLQWLIMDNNQISNLDPLAGLTSLFRLHLAGNQISDLGSLAGLPLLWELNLNGNQISDLSPLEELTGLSWLRLSDNQISDASSLAGLTNLTWLYLSDNQLVDISPLAGLTNLGWLYLSDNQISDIDPLAGLPSMWELYLDGNQISDLAPLTGLTNLFRLHLADNQISDLSPLAGLTSIYELDLADNQISDLGPLAGLTSLYELDLAENQISDLDPLAGMTSVYKLDLSENQIGDLSPLAGLMIHYSLRLDGNQIGDLSPLAAMTSMVELHLADNQISDLSPLAGMTSLGDLDLSDNQISRIHSLLENPGIGQQDVVRLGANPLSSGSCIVFIPELEGRGVTVLHGCSSEMAEIPEGCFDMGDHFSEEVPNPFPVHNVCISAFDMDTQEVTNADYAECEVAGICTPPTASGSFSRPSYYGNPSYDDFPVVRVDWYQAVDYCAWLSKRLPTDAEWEYAARGGLSGKRYPWGDTISGSDANYLNSGDPWDNDTSEIEYYAPNGYGLYDVAGNVWEWVNDWYQEDYYAVSPTNDPPGPAVGLARILRGGSWSDDTTDLAVGLSSALNPNIDDRYAIGFRCARGGAYGP